MSSNLSLFSPSDYLCRTKKEKVALLMNELDDFFPSVERNRSTANTVKIERLAEYDYDLFSFDNSNVEALVEETFPEPQRAIWTKVEIGIVHEQLIINLLEDVRDKRVSDKNIIEWLFWVEGNEETLGTPQPFSFEACCIYWGFDPDEFRHRLSYVLRKHRGWKIRWQERGV